MKNFFYPFSILFSIFILFSLMATEPELYDEIIELCQEDQDIRFAWISAETKNEAEFLEKKMIQIDDKHLTRIKEIISLYGWPGFIPKEKIKTTFS